MSVSPAVVYRGAISVIKMENYFNTMWLLCKNYLDTLDICIIQLTKLDRKKCSYMRNITIEHKLN